MCSKGTAPIPPATAESTPGPISPVVVDLETPYEAQAQNSGIFGVIHSSAATATTARGPPPSYEEAVDPANGICT